MGDSTLFYMTKHLYTMLLDKNGRNIIPRQDPGFSNMTLSRGKEYVETHARSLGVSLPCCQHPRPIDIPQDGTHIEWMGMSGPAEDKTKERLDAMFTRAEEIQPEIIVTNMALHWIHLCGHARCPADGIVVKLWLNYKKDWLEKVYDFALKVNAKLLLFKTTNFVCDDARTNDWATYSSLYLAQDSTVLENCTKIIESLVFLNKEDQQHQQEQQPPQQQQQSSTYNFTKEQIQDYCLNGQFTEFGVQYLNRQIVDFVKEKQENNMTGGGSNGTIVGLYNDHDVESCNTTNDAIHHLEKGHVELRVRLLANTIDEYYGCIAERSNITTTASH